MRVCRREKGDELEGKILGDGASRRKCRRMAWYAYISIPFHSEAETSSSGQGDSIRTSTRPILSTTAKLRVSFIHVMTPIASIPTGSVIPLTVAPNTGLVVAQSQQRHDIVEIVPLLHAITKWDIIHGASNFMQHIS